MFLLKKILAALILPPAGPVLLALFGLWLSRACKSRRWQHAGVLLATLALGTLLLLSLPVVGNALMAPLSPYPPLAREQLRQAQAVVILGGGIRHAPEYGGDTVSTATLVRLRYGARLARESHLPLLVTGGAPFGGRAEAEYMRDVLDQEFGLKVRWVEAASRDTAENARLSAPLLKAAGVTRIALVSHGWHLPRATALFESQGLTVLPAPTAFGSDVPATAQALLPGGLGQSRRALNEYFGLLFNRLKE